MILKEINKKIIFTFIFALVVSLGFTKMTYAVFTVNESTVSKTIEFGDISMTVDAGDNQGNYTNVIGTVTNGSATSYVAQYPVHNPTSAYSNTSWTTTNDTYTIAGAANTVTLTPYKFTIENTGDVDLMVTLFLSPDTTISGARSSLNGTGGSKNLATGVIIVGHNILTSTPDLENTALINYTEQYTNAVSSNQYKYFRLALSDDSVNVPNLYNLAADVFLKSNNSETINGSTVYKLETFELDSGQSKTFSLYMWLSIEELQTYSCYTQQVVCDNQANDAGERICNTVDVLKTGTALENCESLENINDVIGRYLVTQISAKGVVIPVS